MAFWHRMFPRYGNWGGPGWSGGAFASKPSDTDWDVDPVDSMDELFCWHDWEYQQAIVEEERMDSRNARFDKADKELLRALKALPADPRKWEKPAARPYYARFYRLLCISAFYPRVII